ncbi:MAG: hypothetical protein R2710_17775 [Acidimicrobiales bacterium]
MLTAVTDPQHDFCVVRALPQFGDHHVVEGGAQTIDDGHEQVVGHRPRRGLAGEGEIDGVGLGPADVDGNRPPRAGGFTQQEDGCIGGHLDADADQFHFDRHGDTVVDATPSHPVDSHRS